MLDEMIYRNASILLECENPRSFFRFLLCGHSLGKNKVAQNLKGKKSYAILLFSNSNNGKF